MSELEKFKLYYEYNENPSEIRKAFSELRKKQKQQLAEIKKKAKAGILLKELAEQHKVSVQKIVSILKKRAKTK